MGQDRIHDPPQHDQVLVVRHRQPDHRDSDRDPATAEDHRQHQAQQQQRAGDGAQAHEAAYLVRFPRRLAEACQIPPGQRGHQAAGDRAGDHAGQESRMPGHGLRDQSQRPAGHATGRTSSGQATRTQLARTGAEHARPDHSRGGTRRCRRGQRTGHRQCERGRRRGGARQPAKALQQVFAHAGPCPRQPLADRLVAQSQQRGHLPRTLALAVEQQQHLAAVLGQGGNDVLGRRLGFTAQQTIGRLGRRIGGHADGDLRRLARQRPLRLRAQPVAGQVAGDLPQPGQETGAVAQAVQLLPRTEEGLLGDVLAGLHVTGDRQGDGGDGVLAGADDAPIGLVAAAPGGGQLGAQHQVQGFGVHGRST